VTASEWFESGVRRPYDPVATTMLPPTGGEDSPTPCTFSKKSLPRRRSVPIPGG
jgi:hypothetical protein